MSGAAGGTQVGGLFISLQGDTSPLNRAMGDARGEMDRTEAAMDSVDQKARALQGAFLVAAAGATAAALGLQQIGQAGMAVEQTFSIVQAASQASASEMNMMRDTAQELGAELPLYLNDIAKGFEQLVYSGMSAEEAIAAVDSVSRLAVAGQLQLAESSRIVTSSLNAFNMEADEAGAVSDGLAAVFASSATSVREAGQALDYTSAAASAAGQNITQTNAAIGALADNGIRGSRAGTSLQNALSRIVSPSGKAADALESVGLSAASFTDEQGNVKDFTEIIRTLSEATEGLTEQERAAFLTDVFGQRGQRAIAPLISDVEALEEKVDQVAGADLAGSFEELQNLDSGELDDRLAGSDVEITPGMNQEEMIAQYAELSGELTDEELQTEIQTTLNVDEGAAETLTENIAAGDSASEINDWLDSVVTSTDLADSRMQSLRGQITYAIGSMQAFAYSAYQALEPVFMLGGSALVGLVDLLNSNAAIAETFGVALLALGAASTAAAIGIAAMIAQMKIQAVTAQAAYTNTYAYTAAQWAYTSATQAATTATTLMTMSTSQLVTRLWAGRAASISAAASKFTLAGAAGVASGALSAAAASALAFMTALGPIGWIAIGVTAAVIAFKSGLLDFIGIGSEAEMVASAIGSTIGWLGGVLGGAAGATGSFLGTLGKLLGIFVKIITLPLALQISFIGAALRHSSEAAGMLASGIGLLLSPLDLLRMYLSWMNQGGLLSPLLGDFNLLGTAIGIVTDPMGALEGYLAWLQQGGLLAPLLGEFWSLEGAIQTILGLIPGLKDIPILGTLAEGMGDGDGALESATKGAMGKVASYLPSSDAERGPLDNITEQGRALPQTVAKGIGQEQGAPIGPAQKMASQLQNALPGPLGGMVGDAAGALTGDGNPLAAAITGPATTQGPPTPMSPGPAAGGAAAPAAGPQQGTSSSGPGGRYGRGPPPSGGQTTSGSGVTVHTEVHYHEGGEGGGGTPSEQRMNEIAEKHTQNLADEINRERRDMAGD
ncbi:phage tail tape measure protein [Saliphagus sp. LR7]|uniref:phage tail tape measure protein n=1 Tax=Saliphagus sp. LR7 TaxID=2282654 RepID=UPI000DF7B94B|nr:phage tail tape measure protein [Saliphagus sp. LR7]